MKLRVVSFLYPGCSEWIAPFFKSLADQSDSAFEITLFADRCDFKAVLPTSTQPVELFHLEQIHTPYQVRLAALTRLKKAYPHDVLVLADIDDLLHPARIAHTRELFDKPGTNLLFCNLLPFDTNGHVNASLSWETPTNPEITATTLFDSNIAGFGNSAIRATIIPDSLESYDFPVIAGDWFFFYCLLKDTSTVAGFHQAPLVWYRQHSSNLAGFKTLTPKQLDRSLKVVLAHFAALFQKYGEPVYDSRMKNLAKLKQRLSAPGARKRYITRMNAKPTKLGYWWSEINIYEEEA
jgi:hypothetical protein